MAILLTGGVGFIGSHTAVACLNAGVDVVLADNFSNSSPKVLDRIEKITGKRPALYNVDVCDKRALRDIFAERSITGVIHFAGLKAVGESVRLPLAYYRNNLDSCLSVLEVMQEFGCKEFVFSSSATVYGDQPAPLTESADTGHCSNPYGWTKFMIEEILKDAAKANPELHVVLLRYFNPIGAHESGLIGENPNGIPNNLMPYITQVAVGKLKQLTIFGDTYDTPDGTGVRDYIHVRARLCGSARRLRSLQPRHRQRRKRSGNGEHLLLGQRRGGSVYHRRTPRGRPSHRLRRPREGRAGSRLARKAHRCRYVPRFVELAEEQPQRLRRLMARG